jgi:hypothetical protein
VPGTRFTSRGANACTPSLATECFDGGRVGRGGNAAVWDGNSSVLREETAPERIQ